ncbi:jg26907, partial [Pararge aegeria aegeria]
IEEKSLNDFSLLMFPELGARHSGVYTCRAANHAAAADYSAVLSVKGEAGRHRRTARVSFRHALHHAGQVRIGRLHTLLSTFWSFLMTFSFTVQANDISIGLTKNAHNCEKLEVREGDRTWTPQKLVRSPHHRRLIKRNEKDILITKLQQYNVIEAAYD